MNGSTPVSSKGQIVIPAEIRKQMHLEAGDTLELDYHAESKTISLRKAMTIEELSQIASSFMKPGTKPVLNVDEYYQKNRIPRTG